MTRGYIVERPSARDAGATVTACGAWVNRGAGRTSVGWWTWGGGWMCVPPAMKTVARMATPQRHRDMAMQVEAARALVYASASNRAP